MRDGPEIVYQKHTVPSAVAMGVCAVGVAFIVSCTAVVIYEMHLFSEKSNHPASFAEDAIRRLPSLRKALPPALADGLDDRRRPDYCKHIEIFAETKPSEDDPKLLHTTVKVINDGSETVSLLSLRVVLLNAAGEILAASNEWAATPVTAEPEWRGPLLPRYLRYVGFTTSPALPASSLGNLRTRVEITGLRICRSQKKAIVPAAGRAAPPTR
jgi:hypothetical protein